MKGGKYSQRCKVVPMGQSSDTLNGRLAHDLVIVVIDSARQCVGKLYKHAAKGLIGHR